MKASIVLGLGYGDEGKGLTTDYLCSLKSNPIVVRFSGGQQVGHTVKYNGYTHVHSNFGSGTLRGVATYYSEHCTFYPLTMQNELDILKIKCLIPPKVILHPLTKITTPWDVMANREDSANLSHGTCGLGVGKTMKRSESPYKLYAVDLLDLNQFFYKLSSISNYYKNSMNEEDLITEMNDYVTSLYNYNWVVEDYDYLKQYDNLIFEGSQGILLDMDHGVFPHVTYANTTSKNALEICDKIDCKDKEIYYITRCYATRHGEGHFTENTMVLTNTKDETNETNEFQGRFRIGDFNYGAVNQALAYDNIYSGDIFKNIVFTCTDQTKFRPSLDKIETQFRDIYYSKGPTALDIYNINP